MRKVSEMGKKSIKENKNIYQVCREKCEYTRQKASEEMVYISDDRIEKIESEKMKYWLWQSAIRHRSFAIIFVPMSVL